MEGTGDDEDKFQSKIDNSQTIFNAEDSHLTGEGTLINCVQFSSFLHSNFFLLAVYWCFRGGKRCKLDSALLPVLFPHSPDCTAKCDFCRTAVLLPSPTPNAAGGIPAVYFVQFVLSPLQKIKYIMNPLYPDYKRPYVTLTQSKWVAFTVSAPVDPLLCLGFR